MRICIVGAGAMGSLFGGYLSKENDVYLIDTNQARVAMIVKSGVHILEQDGSEHVYHPKASVDSTGLPEMELVIVFVKAMYTLAALEANRHLIGRTTYLMTLQNGEGHEEKLLRFADRAHVVIGSTQHNGSLTGEGCVSHGGGGCTSIGLLEGDGSALQPIAENLTRCGFPCSVSAQVKRQIWEKLFLNTAASSLTAVLQVPLGFILEDPYACGLMEKLAAEAAAVANAEGLVSVDPERIVAGIKAVLANAKGGYTSIYMDVKNGARSEVDTISGSVVETAHRVGVPVPYHEMVVSLIHALENKNRQHIN